MYPVTLTGRVVTMNDNHVVSATFDPDPSTTVDAGTVTAPPTTSPTANNSPAAGDTTTPASHGCNAAGDAPTTLLLYVGLLALSAKGTVNVGRRRKTTPVHPEGDRV